jgi:hypothetical protein
VGAVCERLREAGLTLGREDGGVGIAARVRALVLELRLNTARAELARHTGELERLLIPILDRAALPAVQSALQAYAADEGAPAQAENRKPLPDFASLPGAGGRLSERHRNVLVAVGVVLAVAAGAAAALFARGGGAPAATASTTGAGPAGAGPAGAAVAVSVPVEPEPGAGDADPTGRLTSARASAAEQDWQRVVELLTPANVAPGTETFAWDSLLAHAAFAHARRLTAGDPRVRELLLLAWDRADRALARAAFGRGADELRLLRVEACIAGPLECNATDVQQDLILATTSRSPEVSARASAILASGRR